MSLAFGPPPVLRLGAVDWPAASPLCGGFDALERVGLRRDTPEGLVAALQAGQLDAALLPPLAAWQVERVRLVPGLALVAGEADDAWEDAGLRELLRCASTGIAELREAWRVHHEGPLVLLVWACRPRGPFPDIRRALVHAWRHAEGQGLPAGFGYQLGSEESDGLRALLAQAKTHDAADVGQDVVFC